jgi:two-component system, NtrC family, response regulator AlgB
VTLPPLRRRQRDVRPMAEHLLRFFGRQTGKQVTGFTEEALVAVQRYSWPGNVRELRNAVERGVILGTGPEVGLSDLPAQLAGPPPHQFEVGGAVTLDELEAEHIRRVLAGSPSLDEAAHTLGIDPSTLYRKRKKLGI